MNQLHRLEFLIAHAVVILGLATTGRADTAKARAPAKPAGATVGTYDGTYEAGGSASGHCSKAILTVTGDHFRWPWIWHDGQAPRGTPDHDDGTVTGTLSRDGALAGKTADGKIELAGTFDCMAKHPDVCSFTIKSETCDIVVSRVVMGKTDNASLVLIPATPSHPSAAGKSASKSTKAKPGPACVAPGGHSQFLTNCCTKRYVAGSVTKTGDGGGTCQ